MGDGWAERAAVYQTAGGNRKDVRIISAPRWSKVEGENAGARSSEAADITTWTRRNIIMAQPGFETDRICNLVPSRNTGRDWRLEDALQALAIGAPPITLPASVDLREDWWNIGNQERTGSCVGWATADGVARYHLVKSGKIDGPGLLSPRYVWMASKETDQFIERPQTFVEEAGTSLKAAIDIVRKYGAAPESALPFHIETNMYLDGENAFYAAAAQCRIASYFGLGNDPGRWRQWLATQGPILAGLLVDDSFSAAVTTQGEIDRFLPGTVRGGHAVCIVGYRRDGRFIVRNSWGTTWGDKGFGYPSEAYIEAAFFNESYGVTV
jgi:hypothetical protein